MCYEPQLPLILCLREGGTIFHGRLKVLEGVEKDLLFGSFAIEGGYQQDKFASAITRMNCIKPKSRRGWEFVHPPAEEQMRLICGFLYVLRVR